MTVHPDIDGPREGAAYGLRLHGISSRSLIPADGLRWPVVEVRQDGGPMPSGDPWLSDSEGLLDLDDTRRVRVHRGAGLATFSGQRLESDELIHPYLGPPAVAFARWHGREVFHAGAFLADGGAWAVLGPNQAGKSSLLAALVAHGKPVLTDDLLMVAGSTGFAGPRVLDLRDPGADGPTGLRYCSSRRGTRWRVHLEPVAAEAPLRGWFFLSWSPDLELASMRGSDCLSRLAGWRGRPELATDPVQMLELGALPAWELRRPQRWDAMEETVRMLISVTG